MAPATAKKLARDIPPLRAPYAPPDEAIAAELLASASRRSDAEARIDARATRLVKAIRARTGGLGGVEDFLHAYALSTKEGLALMVLAEALLRVPDAETADRLIEDKLQAGDWARHGSRSAPLLVSASAWTLGLTVKVIHPGETPEGIVDALIKRLGLPAVRAATRQAMRLLGSHFVLGQTIEEALGRAGSHREFLYSFDMLGEGARTSADAAHYLDLYATCDRSHRQDRRQRRAPASSWNFGQAFSAASTLRAIVARSRACRTRAEFARAGTARKTSRAQFHNRRRRGGSAGAVARCHRRDIARCLAGRMGWFRACGAGLSEARWASDRLDWRRRGKPEPAADDPSRQGRLLGHRGEARAGARPSRLPGVYAQGDDRPLLPRLRAQVACGAATALSAICDPQCVDRCRA